MEKFELNPHEREARDHKILKQHNAELILIHTSVKLVTRAAKSVRSFTIILIHTSVKLVTNPVLSCLTASCIF